MTCPSQARRPTLHHIGFTSLVGLSVLLFWPSLVSFVRTTLHSDDLSYLLLIAPISLALFYRERRDIFAATNLCLFGIPPAVVGIALYPAGGVVNPASRESLTMLALILVLVGGFLFFYGAAAFRMAVFPLLFLVLAVPPPPMVLDRLILLLQRGSASTAENIFHLLGEPVMRAGFVFYLRDTAIEVAAQCSGIRSFLASIISALLLGHIFLKRTGNKLLLIALAVPLAILKNALRIVSLTLLTVYVDPQILSGNFHRYAGIPLFLLLFLIIFYLARFLQKAETTPLRKGALLLWTTRS